MQITRRRILTTGTAALAAATLPIRAWTQTTLRMGDTEITTLSDGTLSLPADFIFGPMPQDELAALLPGLGIDRGAALTPPCNLTLLRRGDVLALFDAGSGTAFQPTAGSLPDALAAAGIDPFDVTHVVFTHGHPDHLWGVLDDFDEPYFANAEHMMGGIEMDYWMDEATVSTIGAERAAFAVGAKRRLDVIAGDVTRFGDGDEVLPGVVAALTPGHTPGHMGFVIGSGADAVMVLGDAIGNDHVAFARPGWISGSDQDPEAAAATRLAMFDRITADAMAVIGFHLGQGGIGTVERLSEGYAFRPSA
ncbi:MBL fold metallo-hydrolase [Roseicyclus persicicus]|uniref:MBL fold metallo-hydrolase n=1 Tax=Roseicyclus persicicus TaxID=2650661 RepID=A0A7X6H372_9RHOB|nr:MBL fold metallo-hydrolase [Roseibacterium persicicum]NKX46504.1 MBL fold metallo-hydrolase [Roseibacterium persicicum]